MMISPSKKKSSLCRRYTFSMFFPSFLSSADRNFNVVCLEVSASFCLKGVVYMGLNSTAWLSNSILRWSWNPWISLKESGTFWKKKISNRIRISSRLFDDGYVESLLTSHLRQEGIHVYVISVRIFMEVKTDKGREYYVLWFIVESRGANRSSVLQAKCKCKGGLDGGCKHISAAMYSLEDLLKHSRWK